MYNVEAKHSAHREHLLHENGGELPERPNYEYLVRICTRLTLQTIKNKVGRPSLH